MKIYLYTINVKALEGYYLNTSSTLDHEVEVKLQSMQGEYQEAKAVISGIMKDKDEQ